MSGLLTRLVATASGGEDIHQSVRAGSIPARIFSPKAWPDSSTVCVVLTPAMIGNNVYPMGIGSNLNYSCTNTNCCGMPEQIGWPTSRNLENI